MIADRFLALVTLQDAIEPDAFAGQGHPASLYPVLSSQRLQLFIGETTQIFSLGDQGAVMGSLFARSAMRTSSTLAAGARNSGGASLLDTAWGDYVAIVDDPVREEFSILRAPSGGLHAYVARRDHLLLVASDLEDLFACGVPPPDIDWDFVADHIAFPHLRGARTGIAGISELHHGERRVMARRGGTRSEHWSPWRFASAPHIDTDYDARKEELRASVLGCTRALAGRYPRILLELSGGLDSSIVAVGLAGADAEVEAINLVTPSAEGDERRYARAVAEHCGFGLGEAHAEDGVDLTRLPSFRSSRPGWPAVLSGWEAGYIARARASGAAAFFSGSGGDNVFCSLGSAAPAADALLSRGHRSAFGPSLAAVARIHGSTLWTVLRLALRQVARNGKAPLWPRRALFVERSAMPAEPPAHPWLDEPPEALPGKRAHIRSIVAALAHLDGYGRQHIAPSVFPLLAQPVIETCLAIPSWTWVTRGQDRAVARDAFRALLPTGIVDRQTKGMMNLYCAQIFQANRVALRSFLLEGHLAARGLLDRQAIEQYLAQDGPVGDIDFYGLLALADVEAWVRSWTGRPSAAVAA